MLLRFNLPLKKKDAALDESRDIAADVTEADFIPYAYHIAPHTLLTKNGELMQTLRISANAAGVDYESPEPGTLTLRDAVRRTLAETVESDHYAFWFHTLRRRNPIHYAPQFSESFASRLHQAWQQKHRWQHSFSNEVYVTILRQGQSSEMLKSMALSFLPAQNRRHHEEYLERINEELDATAQRLLAGLQQYSNAVRLGFAERQDEEGKARLYSEPLEFLYYLINLGSGSVPVANIDASRQLSENELTFGFDALESRKPEGKRRFAGILTLKGTPELSPAVLDKCLQLPEELVITQTFNYLPKKQALEKHLENRDSIDSNPDPFIAHISGLSAMLGADRGKATDFGEQHTSIAVIRDQYKTLDTAIGNVQDSFSKLGLISVREEIMLEDCFWAQLPGNFPFLRRRTPISSARAAGLARLNHFPAGNANGGPWGPPVTILPTSLGTPYFFNFHHGAVGHTAILDFNSFADERGTSLLNFLLASSRQYKGRLFIFDRNHSARPLIGELGGSYYQPFGEAELGMRPCRLNPLHLEDTRRNRAFLVAWLGHFLNPGLAQEEPVRDMLKGVLDEIYALPPEQRLLATAKRLIAARDESLLAPAHYMLDSLFSGVEDTIDFTDPLCAVEMLGIVNQREMIVPVFSYLLHRMASSLDGTPTLLVLNEAWDLLDNEFFAPRMASLLQMLQQNNAAMIFTTRRFEDYADQYITQQILENTPTKLFFPDDIATDYFPEITGLTKHETKALVRMERQRGQFLLKHGKEVVECTFPLEGLEAFAQTLAGDARALRLMQIQQR